MDIKLVQTAQLREISKLRLQTASLMQALLEARQQLQRSEGEAKNAVERSRAADQRAAEAELESQLILTSLGNRDADVNELENRLEAVEADAADEREWFAKVEADNYAYLQELKARAAEAERHLRAVMLICRTLHDDMARWLAHDDSGESDSNAWVALLNTLVDNMTQAREVTQAAAAWLEAGDK